jgi:hypothetical protein
MTNLSSRYSEKCPECGTRGYLLLPSYGNCKTCLALHITFLDKCFARDDKADPDAIKSAAVEAKDCLGRSVRVGDSVRILGFSNVFMSSLSSGDHVQISEMIGKVFEVEEIDEAGLAWVTKWWHLAGGNSDAHGVGLASLEMELVESRRV